MRDHHEGFTGCIFRKDNGKNQESEAAGLAHQHFRIYRPQFEISMYGFHTSTSLSAPL